jgi:hypothetical protein
MMKNTVVGFGLALAAWAAPNTSLAQGTAAPAPPEPPASPASPSTSAAPASSGAPVPGAPAGAPAAAPTQTFEPAEVFESKPAVVTSLAPLAPPIGTPLTMDEMPIAASNTRVTLNFFGDPMFVISSDAPSHAGFVLNPIDLLLTGRFGELIAMGEIGLDQADGGMVSVDIERLFVGWHAERFAVDAGRTHAELGYWNNAFHHGNWLQLTVDRPRAVRFEDEGGILPIHWVGIQAHWRPLLEGNRRIELVGGVANGRGGVVDDILTQGDVDAQKALLARIELKGFGARALRLGLVGVFDQIGAQPAVAGMFPRPALPDASMREFIGNLFVAYRGSNLTLISEAYDVLHTTEGVVPATGAKGGHWNTVDAFALLGYRLVDFTPYAMGEVRTTPTGDADPFFFPDPTMVAAGEEGIMSNFEEVTAGLRWDFTTWSAFKVEYRYTRFEDTNTDLQRFVVNWSFGL